MENIQTSRAQLRRRPRVCRQFTERFFHGLFLMLGLVTVGCVLLITIFLVLSGIPAIRDIGLFDFLLGDTWESTAQDPKFGILPFILTSVYGTAGATLFGVPVGFFTAVYLAKLAPLRVKSVVGSAVSLLAGIPSVVYGLVGMLILVPGIRTLFHVPDGASLLAAIIVLAVMILPSIIKVSVTALEAVPHEYEEASLALGATPVETYFKVTAPAAKGGGSAGGWPGHRRGYGRDDGLRQRAQHALHLRERALSHHCSCQRDVLLQPREPTKRGAVLHRPGAVPVHPADKRRAELFPQAEQGGLT